jgi:hypothetical protein
MTSAPTQGVKTILHPVTDLAKAKPVCTALLGVEPMADAPYYVGYEVEASRSGSCPTPARGA